jgi:hypothetical protein
MMSSVAATASFICTTPLVTSYKTRGFAKIGKLSSSMSSCAQQFDFIVIGCGSGGSACADRALSYGAKVCLIERGYRQLVSAF